MVDIFDHALLIMIIVGTILLLSLFITCLLCLKSFDTSEQYHEEDGISGYHGPIVQNIPLASIQDIIENNTFLQNEHELTQGIQNLHFYFSLI